MSPAAPASIAVISDIHGNKWALEAVLRDIERCGVNNIVNLGDCLYGPLDPAGTADILLSREFPTVRGNEDRIITESGPDNPTLDFVRGELRREQIDWLAHLPETAVTFDTVFMCHGSPASDTEYLLHEAAARTGRNCSAPAARSKQIFTRNHHPSEPVFWPARRRRFRAAL